MANKQKRFKKFGLAGGRHSSKRKALGYGRKAYKYTSNLKDDSCVLVIRRKIIDKKSVKKVNSVKKMKRFYQIYRSSETGQLRKRFVKRLFHGKPNGYRLINLASLQEHVLDLSLHSATCHKAIDLGSKGISPIELTSEIDTFGLASVLCAKCKGCHREIQFKTSPTLNVNQKSRHFDINVRAVWGSVATGNGHSHLNEFLATTDSPGMNQRTFNKIENDINSWWNSVLQDNLKKAVEEEKEIAIAKGCFHEVVWSVMATAGGMGGVPSITVIADGGWSKRTHKHSYNAMGGVGVIIGAETKKLLHIGIRNKYCCVCQRAESVGCKAKEHECFKNWELSSQAMEADIIVEGFLKANEYGVRYMTLIADGDSSTYAKIQEEVPVWGAHVQKGECANHVCKCLRGNLEKLVDANPSYKGKGNLTKVARVKLTSAVRCAIRMRSNETDKHKATRLLEKDIKNSVYHIFGQHDNCSSDFCKSKTNETQETDENESENLDVDTEDNDFIIDDQIKFWTEGASIQAQEKSRSVSDRNSSLNPKILKDVGIILSKVAQKAPRLIGNYTTNLAECWMHIRSKFDGGKVFNHCLRGSWHTRCFAGGLRYNEGPKWSPLVWEKTTGTKAGEHFQNEYEKRETKVLTNNISKRKPENKLKRWKRKMKSANESNNKKARLEYGPNARDIDLDVSTEELNEKINQFLEKKINISSKEINQIEKETKEQSNSKIWKEERKKRLTSSNFGYVVRRNPKIKVAPLVKNILHSEFKGNKFTQLGLEKEAVTITEYVSQKKEQNENVKVEKMGLIVSQESPFLAASPDGKVIEQNGNHGLVEIKNVLYNKALSLTQAARLKSIKNFCLEFSKNENKLKLKKNHNYCYQCQGLLYVCKMKWIDFVVRTENPYELHIERIMSDEDFIAKIIPKLKQFYHKALLPEIVIPRHGKFPGIREPGIWYEHDQGVEHIKRNTRNPNNRKPPESNVKTQKDPKCSPSTSRTAEIPSTSSNTDPILHISDTGTSSQTAGTSSHTIGISSKTTPREAALGDIPNTRRSRRQTRIKFVGRRISHLWKDSDTDNKTHWYCGSVLSVIRGSDGDEDAVYEVQYDGDDEIYELDNLAADLRDSQLRFIDI